MKTALKEKQEGVVEVEKEKKEKGEGMVIPFPVRFAERSQFKERETFPRRPEIYDDSTTVDTTGQYEDTRTDE